VSTTVDAVTLHEIAVQQVKVEEKQRVLGIVPNFYVSYAKNPVPLSPGLKFHLAVRSLWDPVTIAGSAAIAGYQYEENIFSGYGDGEAGYWKRFGATMGDNLTDTMISGAILPVVLHQDPRYFYKGTGSVKSRAWYAISFVWRCKGDNGRWEVNYSGLLGGLASGAISNAYYPPANRGVQLTIDNWAIGSGFGAVGGLVQEFVMKHLTPGANKMQ